MSKHLDAAGHWDGNEFELEITRDGLSALSRHLREDKLGTYKLCRAAKGSEAGYVSTVMFERAGELITLTIENGCAKFRGSKKSLELLAENLEELSNSWSKGGAQHFHFDPFSDRLLLSPKSEAFIVSPCKSG